MTKIAMTDFAADRHFDPTFAGTKITDMTPEEFTAKVNELAEGAELVEGYAPFCKHLFLRNMTDAHAGVAEITPKNESLLKSGYEARREDELPVLTRWFEGVEAPRAEYLDIVLYSREQLAEEGIEIDADWGVVAILGVMSPEEEPMAPMTMVRNALGKDEGGSGVALDREAYERSVKFWSSHALVR